MPLLFKRPEDVFLFEQLVISRTAATRARAAGYLSEGISRHYSIFVFYECRGMTRLPRVVSITKKSYRDATRHVVCHVILLFHQYIICCQSFFKKPSRTNDFRVASD